MSYPYILTTTSATIIIDGKPHVVADTHPNFNQVVEALRDENWPSLPDLVDIPKAINAYITTADGSLVLDNGQITYLGEPIHNAVTERILAMMEQGFSVNPLLRFLHKVCQNPDPRAVSGLYEWLERGNLPINSDGDIVAYKIVRNDYKDVHSGRYDNSVGAVVEMPRFKCDSDPDRTCSSGLHFCSAAYLPHFGTGNRDRVMLLAISPADVVAFPRDYNISKGRCCKYRVIQEIDKDTAAGFFNSAAVYDFSDDDVYYDAVDIYGYDDDEILG